MQGDRIKHRATEDDLPSSADCDIPLDKCSMSTQSLP